MQSIFIPKAADAQFTAEFYLSEANGDDANDGLTDTTPVATYKRAIEMVPFGCAIGDLRFHLGSGNYDTEGMGLGNRLYQGIVAFVGDGAGQPGDDGKTDEAGASLLTAGPLTAQTGLDITGLGFAADVWDDAFIEMLSGPAIGDIRQVRVQTVAIADTSERFTAAPVPGDTFRVFRPAVTLTGTGETDLIQSCGVGGRGAGPETPALILQNIARAGALISLSDSLVYMLGVTQGGAGASFDAPRTAVHWGHLHNGNFVSFTTDAEILAFLQASPVVAGRPLSTSSFVGWGCSANPIVSAAGWKGGYKTGEGESNQEFGLMMGGRLRGRLGLLNGSFQEFRQIATTGVDATLPIRLDAGMLVSGLSQAAEQGARIELGPDAFSGGLGMVINEGSRVQAQDPARWTFNSDQGMAMATGGSFTALVAGLPTFNLTIPANEVLVGDLAFVLYSTIPAPGNLTDAATLTTLRRNA
jgi:hypothetical protein